MCIRDRFNVDKSYGIAFGPNIGNLPSLCVGGKTLQWCNTDKYLGVHLSIDFDVVKRKFYAACSLIVY